MKSASRPLRANDTLTPSRCAWNWQYAGRSLNALLQPLLPRELRITPLDEIDCNGFLPLEDLARVIVALQEAIQRQGRGRATLLELGCGTGGLAHFLARRLSCRVLALDWSEHAIEPARARTTPGANVEFSVAKFEATGLAPGSVAAIYSLDALYLSEDIDGALREARRVLRPGGSIIFTAYATPHGCESPPSAWLDAAKAAGLLAVLCTDRSGRWRSLMRRKHEARWQMAGEVQRLIGSRATVELQVSGAMLGHGASSFIDRTHRFEIRLMRE